MYTFPPILHQMVSDRRINSTDMRVFVCASKYLDVMNFRQLKALPLAHEMRIDVSNVARSLRNLVKYGYLEKRKETAPDGSWIHTLRIPHSQPVAKFTTSQPPDAA
jgi:predicted transcriptional regulator